MSQVGPTTNTFESYGSSINPISTPARTSRIISEPRFKLEFIDSVCEGNNLKPTGTTGAYARTLSSDYSSEGKWATGSFLSEPRDTDYNDNGGGIPLDGANTYTLTKIIDQNLRGQFIMGRDVPVMLDLEGMMPWERAGQTFYYNNVLEPVCYLRLQSFYFWRVPKADTVVEGVGSTEFMVRTDGEPTPGVTSGEGPYFKDRSQYHRWLAGQPFAQSMEFACDRLYMSSNQFDSASNDDPISALQFRIESQAQDFFDNLFEFAALVDKGVYVIVSPEGTGSRIMWTPTDDGIFTGFYGSTARTRNETWRTHLTALGQTPQDYWNEYISGIARNMKSRAETYNLMDKQHGIVIWNRSNATIYQDMVTNWEPLIRNAITYTQENVGFVPYIRTP